MLLSIARFFALAILLTPVPAFAADMTPQQKSFLSSPAHQRDSAEQLKQAVPVVFPGCTALSVSPESYAVAREIEFDDRGNPRVGFWKEVFNAEGCGRKRKLNLFWGSDEKGDMRGVLGMPGVSLADLPTQRAAMNQAIRGAAAKYPTCKTAVIDDTRFDMVLVIPPPVYNAWQETWTVALCDHLVDVPLTFAQSPSSIEITVQTTNVADHK
jgi:hypothetical protein